MLDPARLTCPSALVRSEPFPLLVAQGVLDPAQQDALVRDFPRFRSAGFFPHDPGECGPSLQALVEALCAPPFANALGARLGLEDLAQMPTLVTLCRRLNRRHGTIHTDSRAKIATALLYLNPSWPETSDGCLRFLQRPDDIDALVVPEVRPLFGTVAAFRRTSCSFHGHLPYAGERLVVQVAWLASEAEKQRKTRRGRGSRLLKALAGPLDRWLGGARDRSASHRD